MGKLAVLIADDDLDTVELLRTKFSLQEFNVITALNGQEAIEKYTDSMVAGNEIPLCILDYEMPLIKGDIVASKIFELCDQLEVKHPNIVMFTGSTDPNLMMRLRTSKIEIALIKPAGFSQLDDIINTMKRV